MIKYVSKVILESFERGKFKDVITKRRLKHHYAEIAVKRYPLISLLEEGVIA